MARARRYNKCRTCGGQKKVPKVMQKGLSPAVYEQDPYCSRPCLEIDLGIKKSSEEAA